MLESVKGFFGKKIPNEEMKVVSSISRNTTGQEYKKINQAESVGGLPPINTLESDPTRGMTKEFTEKMMKENPYQMPKDAIAFKKADEIDTIKQLEKTRDDIKKAA